VVEDFWQIFVDPYTAKVIGQRAVRTGDQLFSRAFIPFVFDLHLALLMPYQFGSTVVGIIAILAVISISAGIVLWWPAHRKWRRALTVRWSASDTRLIYDLHQTLGMYPWLVLLAVLVSGIYFNLPATFIAAVRTFSPGTTDASTLMSSRGDSGSAFSIGQATDRIDRLHPEGRLLWMAGATDESGTHWICKGGQISISRIFDVSCFHVDQSNGEVLHIESAATGTAGDRFLAWQWPLHSGRAFGMPGRILVLLSGVACVGLFVTGYIRWSQKRQARLRAAARRTKGDGNASPVS
jgi:uncharacterized iron-regulated membrane protein